MTRLQQYINEIKTSTDIISMIRKDCQPFLKEMKGSRSLLYRGSDQPVDGIEKIVPRNNRIPKNTPLKLHKQLDIVFKKGFGWKARSEGVFVSFDEVEAEFYGETYLFFPIGKYKYVWSSIYRDLTRHYNIDDFKYFANPDGYMEEAWYKHMGGWSEEIYKDKAGLEKWKKENIKKIESEVIGRVGNIIKDYTDKGLGNAKKYMAEVAFKCKSYYLVNTLYGNEIKDELL
jgi:hypothetical protein